MMIPWQGGSKSPISILGLESFDFTIEWQGAIGLIIIRVI